jgi:hypothetical protein
MKLRIRLYGTHRERFPEYDPSQGVEMEVPSGTTVREFLVLLGTSKGKGALVISRGRILKPEDTIDSTAPLGVFQSICGG